MATAETLAPQATQATQAAHVIDNARLSRSAFLTVSEGYDRHRVTAKVSGSMSPDDFGRVARQAYDVISRLTGHPCMSGAFDFVVSREQFKQVINVAF